MFGSVEVPEVIYLYARNMEWKEYGMLLAHEKSDILNLAYSPESREYFEKYTMSFGDDGYYLQLGLLHLEKFLWNNGLEVPWYDVGTRSSVENTLKSLINHALFFFGWAETQGKGVVFPEVQDVGIEKLVREIIEHDLSSDESFTTWLPIGLMATQGTVYTADVNAALRHARNGKDVLVEAYIAKMVNIERENYECAALAQDVIDYYELG